MKPFRFLSLSGLAMLTGCASGAGPTGYGPVTGHATLSLQPEFQDAAYRTQSGGGITQASVVHLQIKLFKLVNNSEQPLVGGGGRQVGLDLLPVAFSLPVTFSNLDVDTTYRVRAYAYGDSGTSNLISTDDSGSYLDVSVGHDDRPTFGALPVRLIGGSSFSAAATMSAGVSLSEGGLAASGSFGLGASYGVTTLAGSASVSGSANGTGTAARFLNPFDVAVDGAGNLYVADEGNFTIRKVTPAGVVTTLAGTAGAPGTADGTGATARFCGSAGVTVDGAGNVYVADSSNNVIRAITPAGVVTTLAGNSSSQGFADATGMSAKFKTPYGVAVDGRGNLYVADAGNHLIRKIVISTGVVTTLAGVVGVSGSTDGTGTSAKFNQPDGVAVDRNGNLYVADCKNHVIRKIVIATRVVTTLAGSPGTPGFADGPGASAMFYNPEKLAADDSGNLYVADFYNRVIRKIVVSTGVVTTLAGKAGVSGFTDGTGTSARFATPCGVAVDRTGTLYVADSSNPSIRMLH